VINDLDDSLKQFLITKVPLETSKVIISFDIPDREWAVSQSKPAVNLYLYDIRENHQLRSYEWNVEKNSNRTATKKKVPSRIDLSYAITVWTKDAVDEHRLMGYLLTTLLRFPILPQEVLQGTLKDLEYPIQVSAAQPDGLFKTPADYWSALDNKLKPSINYVITLPIDLDIAITAPVVSTKTIEVKTLFKEGAEEFVQIGGVVHGKGKPEEGVANVSLLLKELGMTATTDASGRYRFSKISQGSFTVHVSVPKRPVKETRLVVPSDNYNIEV
jgi:hypothetical protein